MTPGTKGRLLGERYRLVERIDEGGAGEVWLARDEKLRRDVAVKVLGPEADAAFRERFTDEARRAAAVSHPNVVTVFDQGQDAVLAYMVMELVRGRTLRDVVTDDGPMAPRDAARVVAQVAAALDAAHAAGVIHCDVKPANVILGESGLAKLTDFGVARAARGPAEHELIGTPRYIAPERIEGKPATAASDVYGLGLVAFELLAGRPPFDAAETEDLLRERLEAPPPSLKRARPDLPAEVDLVVAKALAREPERRYASAGAFARDLVAAMRGERTRTLPVGPAVRQLRRQRGGRIGGAIAVLGVALIVVALALLFMGFPPRVAFPGGVASPTPSARLTPSVVGMPVRQAATVLLQAGFSGPPSDRGKIPWTLTQAPGTPCTVVRQEPAADTPYAPGTEARLVLVAPERGGC